MPSVFFTASAMFPVALCATFAHIAFSLSFLVSILTVNPFLPKPRSHQRRIPFLSTALRALALLLPVIVTVAPLRYPLFALSWTLASAVALRFSYNAPIFDNPQFHEEGNQRALFAPRTLLWRLDVLSYLIFALAHWTFSHSPSAISVSLFILTSLAATAVTVLDIVSRVVYQNLPLNIHSILGVLSVSFQEHPESPPVPPTVFNSCAFRLLSFNWVSPTVATGHVRPLEPSDVQPMADGYAAHVAAGQRFLPYWRDQMSRPAPYKPSVFKALFKAFGTRLLLGGILKLVNDSCIFLSPIILRSVRCHFACLKSSLVFALTISFPCVERMIANKLSFFLSCVLFKHFADYYVPSRTPR